MSTADIGARRVFTTGCHDNAGYAANNNSLCQTTMSPTSSTINGTTTTTTTTSTTTTTTTNITNKPTMKGVSRFDDKVLVRDATPQDFDDVINIDQELYMGRDYLPQTYHRLLATPSHKAVVCLVDGLLIGYAAAHLSDGGQTLALASGRVKRSHRGQGYTKRMLQVIRTHFLFQNRGRLKQEVLVTKGENLMLTKTSLHDKYADVLQKTLVSFVIPNTNRFPETCTHPQGSHHTHPGMHTGLVSPLNPHQAAATISNILSDPSVSSLKRELFGSADYLITNWTPFRLAPENSEDVIKSNDILLLSGLGSHWSNTVYSHTNGSHSVSVSESGLGNHWSNTVYSHTNGSHSVSVSEPGLGSHWSNTVYSHTNGAHSVSGSESGLGSHWSNTVYPHTNGLHSVSVSESGRQETVTKPSQGTNGVPGLHTSSTHATDDGNCVRKRHNALNTNRTINALNDIIQSTSSMTSHCRKLTSFHNDVVKGSATPIRELPVLSVGNCFPCKLGLAYNVDLYFSEDEELPDPLRGVSLRSVGGHMRTHVLRALAQGVQQDGIHMIVFVSAGSDHQKSLVCDVMDRLFGLQPEKWDVQKLHLYRRAI